MEETYWLEAILQGNHDKYGISQVLSVKTESAVPAGSNYASLVIRASVGVMLKSGRKTRISLIIKKSHAEGEKGKLMEKSPVFKNEINFYCNALPKYDDIMNQYQDSSDKLWCKLIGYQCYNTIVFEDLKAKNYRMADRTRLLDKAHAELVMHSLGRFHGTGHALIRTGMISMDDFGPYYLATKSPVMSNMVAGGLRTLCDVIETHWPPEWHNIAKKLREFSNRVMNKLQDLFALTDENFLTVIHGDCWTCNIMFKYCPYNDSLPIGAKFIDFQLPAINSYGFDLAYFLYVSVRSEVRQTHWNELLGLYHKSLLESLTVYGMQKDVPSLQRINAEMERLQSYALVINLVYLAITSAKNENAFMLENIAPTQDGSTAFNPAIFNSEQFKAEVQRELKEWFKDGVF